MSAPYEKGVCGGGRLSGREKRKRKDAVASLEEARP